MPAPSAALRAALDERSPLLRRVEYEEAGAYQPELLAGLKAKYLLLRPDATLAALTASAPVEKENEITLPTPKNVLFPLSLVKHGFRQSWQVGSGMQNIGNTCYLNSTLQALFHVSAFANWLISENHSDRCGQNACIICSMKRTLNDTQNGDNSIKPWQVYSKLRTICRHLVPGRQEDAHEFLRYLVEAMEKAYLAQFDGSNALDQYSKETTPLNQILGGYLRSVVKCLSCNRMSTTFQHFQDLLVDARKASTIDEALEAFFSRERLEDLGYKCSFCDKKVSATKQFYIERAPMVLCIALKRFSITGGKLTKHVQFRPKLSLNKYRFKQNTTSQTLTYRLVSVVTHLGHSQNSGHYTAVGLGPAGTFYQFDDSCVREISTNSVLSTNAYIMFYELLPSNNIINKSNVSSTPLSSCTKEASNFIGPIMPKSFKPEVNAIKLEMPPMDRESLPIATNSKIINNHSVSLNFQASENGSRNVLIPNKDKLLPCSSNSLKSIDTSVKMNGIKENTDNVKQSYCNKAVLVISNTPNLPSCSKSSNGIVKSLLNTNSVLNGKLSSEKRQLNGNHSAEGHNSASKLTNGNHQTSGDNKQTNGDSKFKQLDNGVCSENGLIKTKSKVNGSSAGVSSLVPYECESSGETQDEDDKNSQKSKQLSSISTSQGWKVSCEAPDKRSQSNGDAHDQSLSSNDRNTKDRDTLSQLQRHSHRGYGAPVDTWAGTHAQLNRQVYTDKKSELKRAVDEDDDIDRGRTKKIRYNNNYRYQNGRNSSYNSFQETQNQMNKWGGGKHGYRKNHHYNRNFKYKPKGRFGQRHSHHSNGHYHPYSRNH